MGRLRRDDMLIGGPEPTTDPAHERIPHRTIQVLDESCSFDVALNASSRLLKCGMVAAVLATCLILLV